VHAAQSRLYSRGTRASSPGGSGLRLAEIGCSANQIAAITGHATLKEVQRYTSAADRKRMAREAMAKLIEGGW